MIDIVYPLGHGSKWDDNELRYSLRSVEKHLTGIRDIYIVGAFPDWLQNVKHIPYMDEDRWKEHRIALKILQACIQPGMSDNFLFMNDDHFLLKNFKACEFPFYWKEQLSTSANGRRFDDAYRKSLANTHYALNERGLKTYNFDVHCPIIYNKSMFQAIYKMYDWVNTNYSFVIKSLYCNTMKIEGEQITDIKISNPLFNVDDLKYQLQGRCFFSIGDKAVTRDLTILMEELYPEKSKYEK